MPELATLAAEGSIEWLRREYEPSDLEATFIAIAATNDTDVNIRVYEDAERRAMLVNIVDVPPLCNFILPAIVRTGPLAIAISTAGASRPGQADQEPDRRRVRRAYAALGGCSTYAAAGQGRSRLRGPQSILRGHRRRRPDPIDLLRAGDEAAVLADGAPSASNGATLSA